MTGANTTMVTNSFLGVIARGKAGIWIHAGHPTLINVTGVTGSTSSIWGMFGRTVAEDGDDAFSFPTLIGCNIEDFDSIGVVLKTGSALNQVMNTTWLTAGETDTLIAIKAYSVANTILGQFDSQSTIQLTATDAWLNGYSVHSVGMPFVKIGVGASLNEPQYFYNHVQALAYNVPEISWLNSAFGKYALRFNRVQLDTVDYISYRAESAFTDGDATPSVTGARGQQNVWNTANTASTTITDFDDGDIGQPIMVFIEDGNTTFDFTGTNLYGNSGVDWSPSVNSYLTAIYDGSNWWCDVSSFGVTVAYDTTGSEEITNGTFETNTTGWTSLGSPVTFARNTSSPITGTGDLHFDGHASDASGFYGTAFGVTTGKTYQLGFNYRKSGDQIRFKIGVENALASAQVGGSQQPTLTAATNTLYTATFTATETDASVYPIFFDNASQQGELWVDDITLKEVQRNVKLAPNLLEASSNSNPQFTIEHTADTDYTTIGVDGNGKTTITTVDGGGAAGHLVLAPDGNVGIGETAPDQKLEVTGDVHITGLEGGASNVTVDASGVLVRGGGTSEVTLPSTVLAYGTTPPDQVNAGGYSNLLGWSYDINDGSNFAFELPGDIDTGTDPTVVISWYIAEAFGINSGEVRWRLDWTAVKNDDSEIHTRATDGENNLGPGDIDISATQDNVVKTTFTLANAKLDDGDVIGFSLSRISLAAGLGPTEDPVVIAITFKYTKD